MSIDPSGFDHSALGSLSFLYLDLLPLNSDLAYGGSVIVVDK